MRSKNVLVCLLVAAMSVSLVGCGGSDKGGSKESNAGVSEKGQADQGQVNQGQEDQDQYVNSYLQAEPTTLDPSLRTDTYSSDILMSCMDGLIRTEQEGDEYKIAQGDAESWEINDDQTVWTFHLGKDRKWSDGEPVTAQQYVYSLQRSADPETGCPNADFLVPIVNYNEISRGEKPVEDLGVKAIDDHTLEISLTNPMPSFLESTDGSIFYPQRKDIIDKYGERYGTDVETMVWNGPFKLTEWVHNSSLRLEKNDQYWDKDNVSLSKVNLQILSDTSTIANAFDSGEIDYMSASSSEQVEKYKADSNVKYTPISGGQITFAHINTSDTIFSNKKIRQAFSLGIDREDMNDMAFSGLRQPLYGWIAPALSVGGRSMRAEAGDTIKKQQEELAASGKTAKDLLVEGMEELGLGNDPSNLDITFSLGGTSDWHHTLGEYLQQMYKETLGINLKIDFAEWSIYQNNTKNGNYQIGFMSWGAYYNEPYDMLRLNLRASNQIYTNWGDDEYDNLVQTGVVETDNDKRMKDYIDAENILLDSYAVVPLATTVRHQFTQSYVHNRNADYGTDTLYFAHTGFKYVYTSGR